MTTFLIFIILSYYARVASGQVLMHSSKKCLAPKESSTTPDEGTLLIHTSNCRDRSAFFHFLKNGAIQHIPSGLCVHFTGGRKVPRNRDKAILKSGCSDSRYFFRQLPGGAIQHIGTNKCVRPSSRRIREGTQFILYSGCGESFHQYKFIDIRQGCDICCLEKILKAKRDSNSLDEFFAKSESEAKKLSSVSPTFFSEIRREIPELYKDIFSTFFPVDPKVIENLEKLVKHFGITTVKAYPSLFLAAAFIRRENGVNHNGLAPCGGTGHAIGGTPVVDEDDAYFKSKLNGRELTVMLEEENYKAQKAIDKEREEDERNGINTAEFKISTYQKWFDHLESNKYYKLWTKESIEVARKLCGFSSASEIKFPPRGFGMSAIEYLEYLMSRNQSVFPQNSLNFPWPLSIALNIETSRRECDWIWRRLENGDRLVRYSRYSWDYRKNEVRCKESDWNICSIPRIIEDGGVCGRQSQLARLTDWCVGIPAGGIKQPAHAALYRYIKQDGKYVFKVAQGITSMMNTYAVWKLMDDSLVPSIKPNAEYHKGLLAAMNHGYESYREGRIALLLYSRIYIASKRQGAREILIEALENNPHMMDVWMKLIHEITGNREIPVEGQNVLKRLPNSCPEHFPDSQRNRLLALVNQHLSSYMQMYLDVLLRLISPPSCCSRDKPQYLEAIKKALDKETREIVKDYLFEGYVLCAAKSSSIPEFLDIIKPRAVAMINANNDEEMAAFSDIIKSVGNLVSTRDHTELSKHSAVIVKFFSDICGALPKLHVTRTAWILLKQYQECTNHQLRFLQKYSLDNYKVLSAELETLRKSSARDTSFWIDFYANGWLYGRSADVVPILVGVKRSVDGGKFTEVKVNIAKGKSAVMSSKVEGREASCAVDGGSDYNIGGGSCASTIKEANPWFRVDLGLQTEVYGLLISNANDKHGKYLHSFEIHIGNSLDKNGIVNAKCGNLHGVRPSETRAIFCNPSLSGRYVTINVPAKTTVMTICEVQIFSQQLTEFQTHGVKLNLWRRVGRYLSNFYKNPRYPDNPEDERTLDTIQYKNIGSYYGGRLSTLYRAPESGFYKFHALCDDKCEVFIKDMEADGNEVKIISIPQYTPLYQWNKYPGQNSTAIRLEQGKYYKIVATVIELAGWDYVVMGITLPGGKFVSPIPQKDLFIA